MQQYGIFFLGIIKDHVVLCIGYSDRRRILVVQKHAPEARGPSEDRGRKETTPKQLEVLEIVEFVGYGLNYRSCRVPNLGMV
jgi:hypothetical protein